MLLNELNKILKFIKKMKSDNSLIERGVTKRDGYTLQSTQIISVLDKLCSEHHAMHLVGLQWIFTG